jgi:Ca2+-binding RTX toxin-like protein
MYGIDDFASGGSGDDRIYGNSKNMPPADPEVEADTGFGEALFGGAGNDIIKGYGGIDTLRGGTGHDKVYGGFGDDDIEGNEGKDTLKGE